jgi:flagellar hook-length control protein FliK
MTGVAALPVMSIPGIATAMPKTGDDAPGTDSIFDGLLAALAPIASDQPNGQAQSVAQATPPSPPVASGASFPQAFPDAASLEAALSDAMSITPLLPDAPPTNQAKPDTVLPDPVIDDAAVLPPPQNGPIASVQPRAGRSEKPATHAPANQDTTDDSLVAALTMMMLPQLPPAADAAAAPVNPPAEDVSIANVAETAAPNPLSGMETNPVLQNPVPDATAAIISTDVTAQPAKGETAAIPAQAAAPFVLSQAANAATPPLKGASSSAPDKPAANSTVDPGKTQIAASVSKTIISKAVAQTDNAPPALLNGGSSAKADRAPSTSHVGSETASRPAQDIPAMAVPQPDTLTAPVASNGYVSATAANHAAIELSGITAANASWTGATQSGDTTIRLALSAPGVVADPAGLDALALRIAAKSADGESQFQIRLDPPSLGRIEIHLNMDSQGNAQAQLSADRPQTLDALQRDSSALERALKDAGLDLAGGLSFSLKGDGKSAPWRDSQNSGRGRALQIDAIDTANSIAASLGLTSTGQAWGAASTRLDIRV